MGSLIDNICFASTSEVNNVSVCLQKYTARYHACTCIQVFYGSVQCLKMYMNVKYYHTVRILSPVSSLIRTIYQKRFENKYLRIEFGFPEIKRHTLLSVKPLVQSKHLNIVCLNIRALKNKTTSLFDFIVSQNLGVLALTETWLCNGDNIILNELLPPGYDIRHVDRGRRGGGVALIYKKDI